MPIRRWVAITLMGCVLLFRPPAFGQQATMTLPELEALLEKIVSDIAAENYDGAAQQMPRLGDAFRSDELRNSLRGLTPFGKPLYFDKIIDRVYGKSGKDLIYKIGYQQNILFLRFVIHKQRDNWAVYNFAFQTENQAPLPRVWPHIIP